MEINYTEKKIIDILYKATKEKLKKYKKELKNTKSPERAISLLMSIRIAEDIIKEVEEYYKNK